MYKIVFLFYETMNAIRKLLSSELNDEECDATDDDSTTTAGNITLLYLCQLRLSLNKEFGQERIRSEKDERPDDISEDKIGIKPFYQSKLTIKQNTIAVTLHQAFECMRPGKTLTHFPGDIVGDKKEKYGTSYGEKSDIQRVYFLH